MSPHRTNEALQKLGIQHPIIQGPFGGGLSTERLAAAVSNLGGLGSYGAYQLPPEELGRVADRIRALTDKPFALNLWVSDHDAGGDALSPEDFDRVYRLFEPYYRELGVEKPAMPERFHHRFEDQVEALLEARPPIFSFVFGVPPPRSWRSVGARASSPPARPPRWPKPRPWTRRASTSSWPRASRRADTVLHSSRAPRTR